MQLYSVITLVAALLGCWLIGAAPQADAMPAPTASLDVPYCFPWTEPPAGTDASAFRPFWGTLTGGLFSLKAATGSYSSGVDIYFAITAAGQTFLLNEAGGSDNFADTLELVPWKRGVTDGTTVDVVTGFEWDLLPDGVYGLYLMALPRDATTLDSAYLWWTSIVKDQHKIVADPSCLEFSPSKPSQAVKLVNISPDKAVTITGVSSGTPFFAATAACVGQQLAPSTACTFDVNFSGGSVPVNDQLIIEYQAPSEGISGAAVPESLAVPVTVTGTGTVTECSYALASATAALQPDGTVSAAVAVTSQAGCPLTVNKTVDWISIGDNCATGSVCFTISAPSSAERQAEIKIADSSVGIEQVLSGSCTYTFIWSSRFPASGGEGILAVVTGPECSWRTTADLSSTMITVSDRTVKGSASKTFTVSENTSQTGRSDKIDVMASTVPLELEILQLGSEGSSSTACTYSINPGSKQFDLQGGSDSITVTASGESCIWMARSNNPDWIQLSSGKVGLSTGTVSYNVLPASGANPETTGTISVAGKLFTVTRGVSAPCKYSITAPTSQVPVGGGSYEIKVSSTPNSGCALWTAKSDKDWIEITATNTGTGTARYTVKPNSGTATSTSGICRIIPAACLGKAQSRSGTITIAAGSTTLKQIAVSQAGSDGGSTPPPPPPPPSCKPTYSPAYANYSYAGGSGTITVTAASTCKWSVNVGMSSWVDINEVASASGKSTTSGTGNGTIKYTVYPNDTSLKRSDIISIGGMSFDINQEAGSACTYGLYPLNADASPVPGDYFDADGGYGIIKTTVKTGTNCIWTASTAVDWIVLNSGEQHSGAGQLTYKVKGLPANGTVRSGTITIGTQSFKVTQSATCSVALSAEPVPISSAGTGSGTLSLNVTAGAGCNWSATSSDPSWLKIIGPAGGPVDYISGSGPGLVSYSVDAHADIAKGRGAALAIGGRTFIVMQHKAPDTTKTPATDIESPFVFIPWKYLPKATSGTSTSLQVPLAGTADSFRFGVAVDAGCTDLTNSWLVNSNTATTLKGDQLTRTVSNDLNKTTGKVTFTVAPNPGTADRNGSIDFVSPGSCLKDGATVLLSAAKGDTSFAITQKACTYSVGSIPQILAAGGSFSVGVTADAGCVWTVGNVPAWITITSPVSLQGTGSGNVSFTVDPNTAVEVRTGTMTIAGQTVAVRQSGQSSGSEITYINIGVSGALFGESNPARKTTNISAPNWGRSAKFYEVPIDIPAGKQCFLQFNLGLEMMSPYDNNFLVSDTKFTTLDDAWGAYLTGLCKQGPGDIDPKTGYCKNGYNFAKKTTFQTSTGATANIFANNDPFYGSNDLFWGYVPSGASYYVMIVGESPEDSGVWRFSVVCGYQ